jgi:hypothetical protein
MIKSKLEKYGYSYTEKNNELIVRLDFSQIVSLRFLDNGQIIIKDKLKAWNFLTGILNMSLKNAVIYQTIGIFIAVGFLIFFGLSNPDLFLPFIFVLLALLTSISIWTIYYLTKLEHFKNQIICWTKN